jgi:prophage regulatory protein
MDDELLSIYEVTEMLDVSRSTIYRWANNGSFPKQRNIGPNTVRWRLSEIEKWQQRVFS